MKLEMKVPALIFAMLALLAPAAYAESTPEQLAQMVGQLKRSPSDSSLREQIIKEAQEIKPAPAVPEEAEKFEGRAQFAFKSAKSPADYLEAAKEYEKAVAVAPWVAGYYSDLCTIYEKAEKYAEAKKSCGFFLASSPSAQETSDTRKRIAGLEFAIEKANSPEVRAAQEKAKQEEWLRSLDGAKFVLHNWYSEARFDYVMEVRGKTITQKDILLWAIPEQLSYRQNKGFKPNHIGEETASEDGLYRWDNGKFTCVVRTRVPWADGRVDERVEHLVATISPDGQSLTIKSDGANDGKIYKRQ